MARPHGRVEVDARWPRAKAVCDRCGFLYNLDKLNWQFQWAGTKLQNLRILVCDPCLDKPQPQLRTIMLPPDPVAVINPRPENYTTTDNPLSTIAISAIVGNGDAIGSFSNLNSAFDGNTNKNSRFCAFVPNSVVGYSNTLGKNWGAPTQPVAAAASSQTYNVSSFTITAPYDGKFSDGGAVGYKFQGSTDGSTWTDLYTGTTAGTVGEAITATPTGGNYQYHRVNFNGDGTSALYLAQLSMTAPETNGEF